MTYNGFMRPSVKVRIILSVISLLRVFTYFWSSEFQRVISVENGKCESMRFWWKIISVCVLTPFCASIWVSISFLFFEWEIETWWANETTELSLPARPKHLRISYISQWRSFWVLYRPSRCVYAVTLYGHNVVQIFMSIYILRVRTIPEPDSDE